MSKNFRYFFYVFIISVIGIFVMNKFKEKSWALTLMIIFISIAVLIFIAYVILLLFCYLDNKKMSKMLAADDYNSLIKHCEKNKKTMKYLLSERTTYYEYLSMLSYFALNDTVKIDENIEKLKDKMDLYPMLYYWCAGYEFSNNKFENIGNYKEKFINCFEISKDIEKYQNLINVLDSYILFIENKYDEAKEIANKLDMSQISMPSTLMSLNIIKNKMED